jgi:hypothetical protein
MNALRVCALSLSGLVIDASSAEPISNTVQRSPTVKVTPADLPDPSLFFNNETQGIIIRSIKDFPEASRIKFEAQFKSESSTAKTAKAGTVVVWDKGVIENDGPRRIAKAFAENAKIRGRERDQEYAFKFSNISGTALGKLQPLGTLPSGDPSQVPYTSATRYFIDDKGSIFSLEESDYSSVGATMLMKESLAVDVGGKLGQLVRVKNAKGDQTWMLLWINKARVLALNVNCETGACIDAEEMLKIGTAIVSPDQMH